MAADWCARPGSWIALVAGFAGMRYREETAHFAPRLPENLSRLAFSVRVRRRSLRVEITDSRGTYPLAEGEPLRIGHCGESLTVSRDTPQTRTVERPAPLPEPAQPPGRRPRRPAPAPGRAEADAEPG